MKRIITVILMCMMFLSLFTACGSKDKVNNSIEDSKEKSTIAAEQVEIEETLSEVSDINDSETSTDSPMEEKEGEYGNLRYLIQNGEVIITDCIMNDIITSVKIPEAIEGFPVTTIAAYAFDDINGRYLESISFPETVTKIGVNAFSGTAWLENKRKENPIVIENNILISWDWTKTYTDVIIPDGVISIADNAFEDYDDMTSVTIPNSVMYIGNSAFWNCYDLTNVIMSDNIVEIGTGAFESCVNLTSITIPNGAESIGRYAFYKCKNLSDITITDSVENIGKSAFGECLEVTPWLEEKRKENPLVVVNSIVIDGYTCNGDVIIPENITKIADGAFGGSELNSITFPDSVVSIGEEAFSGCDNLSSITIPDGIVSINEWAFSGCDNLSSVTIPDSVVSINQSAFFSCNNLSSITIPSSVKNIGLISFAMCENLKEITFLNPECEIYPHRSTIYNQKDSDGNLRYDGVIKGYENSTAQEYAEHYGYQFIAI